MGIWKDINHWVDKRLLDAGVIRTEDALATVFEGDLGRAIVQDMKSLRTAESMTDPLSRSKKMDQLEARIKKALFQLSEGDRAKGMTLLNSQGLGSQGSGYNPKGSILRKLLPAPFAPYAFLGDNYWSVWAARREVRVEVITDSYTFNSRQGTSNKKVRLAYDLLTQLDLLTKVDEMVDHLNLYANLWLRPVKNALGGTIRYEILEPERISIKWDVSKTAIEGWWYNEYGERTYLPKDQVIHLMTYSSRTQQLGSPALSGLLVSIEACMQADLYNHTLFHRGGLVGNIIGLKSNPGGATGNTDQWSILCDAIQARFDKQWGGTQGAGANILSPMVENVFRLTKPSDLDTPHKWYVDRVDARVAKVLGCAPERLGIPVTSQYQDKGLTADRITESFDNNTAYLSNIVYGFFNTILKQAGFLDVYICSGAAYKARALAAAQYGEAISKYGVMTKNEFRTGVLKMPAWPSEYGDVIMNRDPIDRNVESTPNQTAEPVPQDGYSVTRVSTKAMPKSEWITHTAEQVKAYPKYTYSEYRKAA